MIHLKNVIPLWRAETSSTCNQLTEEELQLLEESLEDFEKLDDWLKDTNQTLEEFLELYKLNKERRRWAESKKKRKNRF